MNFSTPLSFPMSFNHPHVYYPPSYSFPQASEPIQISKLNPRDLQRPPQQDEIYNQQYNDDKDYIKSEPVKKVKVSTGYHMGLETPAAHFLMPGQRNETIKNTNMTSSFHTGCVSAPHYSDHRISSNQKLGLNQGVNLRVEPKSAFEDDKNLCFPLNSRGLQNFDPRNGSHPMSFNPNSIRGWPSNFPHFPSNQVQVPYQQLELLQNLQQQMVSSQKAYEHLMAKNMNPMLQNSMYYNPQTLNLYKQAQSEQHAISMALNAQNQLRMEREAQRKQTEIPVTSSAPMKEVNSMSLAQVSGEPILFDDFPEVHLDHSFFPDLFTLESESTYERMLAEEVKAKDFDDIDDKKTAASSVSTSHIEEGLPKDLSNNYRFDFHGLDHNLKHQEKKTGNTEKYMKFLNPDKQKKVNEDTLLKKREFEALEKEEQAEKTNKGVKKVINERIQVTEASKPKIQTKNIISSIGISTVSQSQSLKPFDAVNKLIKEQTPSPASSSKESKQAKRGRKPNASKLLNVKPAQNFSEEEVKKLYMFPAQTESQNDEQKIEKTRVGRNFQVPVGAFDFKRVPAKKTKTIKSVWNPSLLDPKRIEGFDVELKEIFGQDVTNQEAALKILRGTGMDVDSTVDIFRRNMEYFKAILFPEPKPLKPSRADRSYWLH